MWRASPEPSWDLEAWRDAARAAWRAGIAPEQLEWSAAGAGLLEAADVAIAPVVRGAPKVGRGFVELARHALAHRDGEAAALLYRLLWRVGNGERQLPEFASDPDVRRARLLEKAVTRDMHKMKAFVRFREVHGVANAFVAWYEPDHHVLDLVAPFFARRFAGMRWAIATPGRTATWDGTGLVLTPDGDRSSVPSADAGEVLWQRYYASIFNPARLNEKAMRAEMPVRFWKHLPETRELPVLVRDAGARVEAMVARAPEPARRRIPAPAAATMPGEGAAALAAAVQACRACPLWAPATQAVVGEGPFDARIVFIGEQPGDEEDLIGRPFAGPAGRLFDRALQQLGIDRAACYVTNAVKHFKFEQRGKHRLHVRANAAEQGACRRWLDAEFAAIRPDTVVCLGATAANAVLGPGFALMRERGRWHRRDGLRVLATVHPSWVLRQRADAAEAAYAGFVADLAKVVATGRAA